MGEPIRSADAILRRLQDRVDILEMVYSYCRHADLLDPAGMVKHFTEDCIVVFHDDGPTLRGAQELFDRLTERLGVTISGSHHISNEEILFEGAGKASGYMYMYSWQRFQGYPDISDVHRWGRYEMRFEQKAGGWRIARMRLLSAGEYGGHRIGEQLGKPWPPQFPQKEVRRGPI